MKYRFGLFHLFWFVTLFANAVPPQWWQDVHRYDGRSDWSEYYTYTASYFGPNALPVPELSDGRIPGKHHVEISSDVFWGFGDQTQSLSPRLTYVFIPGKLAVSGWGVLMEHYKTSTDIRDQRSSMVEKAEETLVVGDFYLSTQIGLCKETSYRPDLALEIVLKTASSATSSGARYFDTPGYYFDITAGKSLLFPHAYIREIRLVGMVGFLCYQLNSYRQNDAPLYGGKLMLSSENCSFESGVEGYNGWLKNGDAPLVLRSRLSIRQKSEHYFLQYQHALRDFPFRRLQVGVGFDL